MAMSSVLATMPDLWQRTLATHVPDEFGYCITCQDDYGARAEWPCLSYAIADDARHMCDRGATSSSGRHAL